MTAVLLVAHGSRDPRAAATTRTLARVVSGLRPGYRVGVAFLDHSGPRVAEALFDLAAEGHRSALVVPLLLTSAYHDRIDLPAVLAQARTAGLRMDIDVAGVLGPTALGPTALGPTALGPTRGAMPGLLLAGLRRRLRETGADYDAVVLTAAGTSDTAARSTVDIAADALGAVLGVPCRSAYASAAGPAPAEAVRALHETGARRVALAAYFLATGRLYRAAAGAALAAGAVAVAEPLGAAPELAQLVLDRVAESRSRDLVGAA